MIIYIINIGALLVEAMLKMGYSHKEVLTKDQSDKKVKRERQRQEKDEDEARKKEENKEREKANNNNANVVIIIEKSN